jgi:hypothetical protein
VVDQKKKGKPFTESAKVDQNNKGNPAPGVFNGWTRRKMETSPRFYTTTKRK